ncbi:aspartate aminotransferase family protein [Desulfospira joergensenii]|uniref:aminotransferase family protein n=1 Tax=Desulfospira joergensenii TaxID=53329 RepID=UPI0003B77F38|nr:aspartate aminotransferase family protein [Desulfospira joergensenii]
MDSKSHVFSRAINKDLPVAVHAKGIFITDREGNKYLDASGGPMVVNIGHGRAELARAAHDQILTCGYTHPTMFANKAVEDLSDMLAARTPKGIDRFYFMTSGAEANETAVKLARQIHLEKGNPGKTRLISRWDSYHGLSLGALSATGRKYFRAPFLPMLPDTMHIPAPFCFRCPFERNSGSCRLECAMALEEAILESGPETVSAFLMETVSGAALACAVPPPGYLEKIRKICDRYDVMLILDEILCGLGRCGAWSASELFNLIPDIMTLGKGLGGGAIAVSAVGVQETHYQAIRKGSGSFVHGGTFSHHNVGAAVGKTVMSILEKEDLITRARQTGEYLGQCLEKKILPFPFVGDVRGMGLLWGIEFVRDKKTKAPFPKEKGMSQRVWESLFKRGVAAYKSTGFARGHGDALILAPPFVIERDQVDFMVDALGAGLEEIYNELDL